MPRRRAPKRRRTKKAAVEKPLYEIEYISRARVMFDSKTWRLNWAYEVKWLNWSHEHDSWEPETSFPKEDRTILKSFWIDIDNKYGRRGEHSISNEQIKYVDLEFEPSKQWIHEQKTLAVEATDLELHLAPDSRAVSPCNGAGEELTVEEGQWKQGAMARDDDPGSQSESECGPEQESEESDSSESEPEEPLRPKGRVYAPIPPNPGRRKYWKENPPQASVLSGEMPTPREVVEHARSERAQISGTRIFVAPVRQNGVIRANKKRKLESHPRGPINAPPRPLIDEDHQDIDMEQGLVLQYGAMHAGTTQTEGDQEHPESGRDGGPAAEEPPHEERFFAADNEQDDTHRESDHNLVLYCPPASSPVPESPVTAVANTSPTDVFGSGQHPLDATALPEIVPLAMLELSDLITEEILDIRGNAGEICERESSPDTLASTEVTMEDDASQALAEPVFRKVKSASAKDAHGQEDDNASAMDVDKEDPTGAGLGSGEEDNSEKEEDHVEAILEEVCMIEEEISEVESELEEGEIRE